MLVQITDPHDPRIADYHNLTDAQLRARTHQGVFIAEGELVVRRLLSSRFPTRSVLVASSAQHRLANLPLDAETPVFVADEGVLQSIVGFPFHRGILASGERLPAPPLQDLLASRVLIVLEDMANTDNMGSVFRNTACLAGHGAGIILSPGCCDPLYRKALRVSIGYALTIRYATAQPWPTVLDQVSAAGFELLALTPDPAAVSLNGLARQGFSKYALVLGAEGPGLSREAFDRCTTRVKIPMAAGADSLNVATAGAIALSRLVQPH